ncbi:Arylsulfatase [Pirellulimonas nuda]|uniref:Arylsulfatase n=1 Tax=Pirellulimonas nuda TaxID=2528009 RepID=A0A518DE09_9BACT|nr:sulfatase-like hydrolase/transferase [Pirellulimonas nuda]QDU89703.1 Arylsulfatase [Pirellulimonas nuda]
MPSPLRTSRRQSPAVDVSWFLALTICCANQAGAAPAAPRPNVLLIVADDLGYSDLGCYGGEIDTPHIDRLAAQGLRFTDYYVNPMCVVTRTSLMTGHTHAQSDGYRHSLPIARVMRDAGYQTSLTGKWHQPGNPLDAGFDAFYGFLDGQINSWTGAEAGAPQIQTGRGAPEPTPAGWYSTDAFTDHAIQQIDAALGQGRPFFSYVAYNAPHSPLHAPRANVEKYPQRYRAGWETLREARFQRQRAMGLVDDRYRLTEPEAEVRRWDEMPPDDQHTEARRMAAYAGMVDRLDENIGRLLAHLAERGVHDNTLVVFMSDNGGDYGNGDIHTYHQQVPWDKDSLPFSATGWAMLKNTPFRWYKSSASNGGVRVPLVVRWPDGISLPPGSFVRQRLHVTDLYPTFLELAGAQYPASDAGRKLKPLYGGSAVRLFSDPGLGERAIHDEVFWSFLTTTGQRGLMSGGWKIVSLNDSPWMLFNVAEDPAESHDLAAEQPQRLAALSRRWARFAAEETNLKPRDRGPLRTERQGWGMHRARMVLPQLVDLSPREAAMDVPLDTGLALEFSGPVEFSGADAESLRLYAVDDPENAVWKSTSAPESLSQDKQRIEFNNLPKLKPATTYFLLSDPGWIKVGGQPSGPLNDGAYWWRFRTAQSAVEAAGR